MKTDQPFLFGLTNDAFGYMLSKEDFNSFERYEYISRTSLGEMTGEIYETEAIKGGSKNSFFPFFFKMFFPCANCILIFFNETSLKMH